MMLGYEFLEMENAISFAGKIFAEIIVLNEVIRVSLNQRRVPLLENKALYLNT